VLKQLQVVPLVLQAALMTSNPLRREDWSELLTQICRCFIAAGSPLDNLWTKVLNSTDSSAVVRPVVFRAAVSLVERALSVPVLSSELVHACCCIVSSYHHVSKVKQRLWLLGAGFRGQPRATIDLVLSMVGGRIANALPRSQSGFTRCKRQWSSIREKTWLMCWWQRLVDRVEN
jgi:hypothetical protein